MMPTNLSSEITSTAPMPSSAIFSIASKTDCSGLTEKIRLFPLVRNNASIVSVIFIIPSDCVQELNSNPGKDDRACIPPQKKHGTPICGGDPISFCGYFSLPCAADHPERKGHSSPYKAIALWHSHTRLEQSR